MRIILLFFFVIIVELFYRFHFTLTFVSNVQHVRLSWNAPTHFFHNKPRIFWLFYHFHCIFLLTFKNKREQHETVYMPGLIVFTFKSATAIIMVFVWYSESVKILSRILSNLFENNKWTFQSWFFFSVRFVDNFNTYNLVHAISILFIPTPTLQIL